MPTTVRNLRQRLFDVSNQEIPVLVDGQAEWIVKAKVNQCEITTKRKVLVLVINTDDPGIYNGPRLSVHLSRKEAIADLHEWMQEELDREFPVKQTALQANQWVRQNPRRSWKVEECSL